MTVIAQLALLGVTVIWGWTFVLVKESLEQVGPLAFLFYRFALALAVLVVVFRGHLRHIGLDNWLQGGWIGAALFGGYWFQTWGLRTTSATHSGFITGLSVVLVPLLGRAWFRQRVPRRAWLGVGLSTAGLGFILLGGGPAGSGFNRGDALTLLCAASFALQILLISAFARPHNYVPLLIVQLAVVTGLSGGGMALGEGVAWPQGALAWRGIGLTALLATALALWVQARFQPLSSATHTAIIFSSEPAFAALFGFWLLGERLVAWQWAGAGLILTAMLVAQWPSSRSALTQG